MKMSFWSRNKNKICILSCSFVILALVIALTVALVVVDTSPTPPEIPKEPTKPGWGQWAEWTRCSAPCGEG